MCDVVTADLDCAVHAGAVLILLDEYASGPMGGGQRLSDFARTHLIAELRRRPNARVLLAFDEQVPAGLLIAFEGFSTFACKPLLNVHDLIVSAPYRGCGLSILLLRKLESIAAGMGCCKLTLEVLDGNTAAQAAYRSFGFAPYRLDPATGVAVFWQKDM